MIFSFKPDLPSKKTQKLAGTSFSPGRWYSFICFIKSLFLKKPLPPTREQRSSRHGKRHSSCNSRKCWVSWLWVRKTDSLDCCTQFSMPSVTPCIEEEQSLCGHFRSFSRFLLADCFGFSDESQSSRSDVMSILWYPFKCWVRWSRRRKAFIPRCLLQCGQGKVVET